MDTKKLYKTLFIAASCCIDSNFRHDTEAVKLKRDQACSDMYGRSYDKLTESQLVDVINQLQIQSGYTAPEQVRSPIASNKQLKMLRFYAMSCALHFMDFDDVEVRDTRTGDILSGYDLKFSSLHLFETRKGWLPPGVYRAIHSDWINPKMHKFLIEGGFKKYTKNKERFHWEYLKPQEAQYLITRFQQMFQNITDAFVPGQIQEMINEN